MNDYGERSGFIPIESIRWDSSWPVLSKAADRHRLFSYLEDRFGIPEELFEDYLLFRKRKSWWLLTHSPLVGAAAHFKVSIPGFKAFQKINRFVKPTTRFIQVFGRHATRAILNLKRSEFVNLKTGTPFRADQALENGYVILSFKEHPLGLGLLIDGVIHPQIPRKERRFFRM
jgi:NOL1/NOP2/fmu family ribosome biogenesis protein